MGRGGRTGRSGAHDEDVGLDGGTSSPTRGGTSAVSNKIGGDCARENLHELCEPTLRLGLRARHSGAVASDAGISHATRNPPRITCGRGCENARCGGERAIPAAPRCRCRRSRSTRGAHAADRAPHQSPDGLVVAPLGPGELDQEPGGGRPQGELQHLHPPTVDPDHRRPSCRGELAGQPPPDRVRRVAGQHPIDLDRAGERASRPVIRAAAGPPPGGSSRRNDTAGQRPLGTDHDHPTSAGSPSRAVSSSGATVDVGGQLVAAEPAGGPPASTIATRRTGHRVSAEGVAHRHELGVDSASSAWGSEPATMPQPANSRICRGSVSSRCRSAARSPTPRRPGRRSSRPVRRSARGPGAPARR